MKKVTIRIFLSIFVLWFFSLWLNVVYGQTQDYPDYGSSNNCWNLPNHSSDSINGSSYTTNPSSPYPWYINNSNAINYATNHQWNLNVCSNTNLANNVSRTDWKKQLCTSNVNQLKDHQEKLLTKYKNSIDYEYERWFASTEQVWGLQNLMKKANCQNHRDCKLWVVTIWDFLFCNVCQAISGDRKELKSFNPLKCEDWYTLTDDNLCCMPTPECVAPTITIQGGVSETEYEWSGDLTVKIDYSNNQNWNLSYNFNKIDVNWAINKEDYSTWDKLIEFTITPKDWENQITINVEEWCAILTILDVDKTCPWTEIQIHRNIDCQLTKDWSDCESIIWLDPQPTPWFTGFASLLWDDVLCERWDKQIKFCPDQCTSWKLDDETCEQTYGIWWFSDNTTPSCCNKCPSNKKVNEEWDDCVCTTSSDCNQSWYVFNDETCKCECDPTQRCCGILLNTVVPFIGDCIEMTTQNSISDPSDPNKSRVNQLNAFPFLMMWLSKILVTIILIFSFLIIIAAWLMMTTGVYKEQNYKTWVDRITKVIVWLILLWASGLILRLINPSFFGW